MRRGELIATNEATVMSKPLLDPIVVENGQGDGRLADSAGTDESDWSEVFGEIDYSLDQLVTSEERPWWQRWGFSRYSEFKCEIMDPLAVQIADLVLAYATMSSRSAVDRVRVSLTNGILPSLPS